MIDAKNAHNNDRKHAHDQVKHNVEVGFKSEFNGQIFVTKRFESER